MILKDYSEQLAINNRVFEKILVIGVCVNELPYVASVAFITTLDEIKTAVMTEHNTPPETINELLTLFANVDSRVKDFNHVEVFFTHNSAKRTEDIYTEECNDMKDQLSFEYTRMTIICSHINFFAKFLTP